MKKSISRKTKASPSPHSSHIFHEGLFILLGAVTILSFFFLDYSFSSSFFSDSQNTNVSAQDVVFQSDPFISVPASLHTPVPIFSLDPYKGSPQAKVAVVLFGNFKDQRVQEVLNRLDALYSDNILVIWKDLINPDDPDALEKAKAAHCASLQRKFWFFVEKLSEGENITSLKEELSLDSDSFQDCIENENFETLIQQRYYYANSLNLISVPWLYVNYQLIQNLDDFDLIQQVIENELQKSS